MKRGFTADNSQYSAAPQCRERITKKTGLLQRYAAALFCYVYCNVYLLPKLLTNLSNAAMPSGVRL